MYYLFKAALVTWHSGITVQANFTTGNPYDNINTALWDSSEPLLAPPPDIQFSIDTQWPRLDLYRVGLFHIISSKLAGIFQKYAVKHETFPVHLVDKEDTNVTLEIYYLFRLLLIPGAGHFPHIEAPEHFWPPVTTFLNGAWPAEAEPPERSP